MTTIYRQGGKGALLDEYERAISELEQVIATITDSQLSHVVDNATNDDWCRSIRTILAHVVRAGFNYATAIMRLRGEEVEYRKAEFRDKASGYIADLNEMFSFTLTAFNTIPEEATIEHEQDKKILSTWGQLYDIEQMMEHAIVHILRHRRQIEHFRLKLENTV